MSPGEAATLRRLEAGQMQAPLDEEALGEEESQEGGLGPALTLLKSILGGKQAEETAPGPEVSPERREELVSMGKISLERRREEIRRGALAGEGRGPSGEEMSYAVSRATLVEVSLIRNDPTFNNTRLYDEVFREDLATNEGQKLNDLERSMDEEGLKVPVTLTEGPGQSYFIVAGFRRIKCAKKLRWKLVPAIVLPRNTPLSSMYWCNILENATRKSLTTYETAKAAQLMRDKFGIKAADFARKTGYSESHVSKLLSCIDKLPEYLLDQWKAGGGLSFDEWYRLSLLEPDNAIKYFHRWTGLRPRDAMKEIDGKRSDRRLAPARFLDRMQRFYIGIEGSDALEPKTRSLVLASIEVCMGQRNSIPGVYDPRKKSDYERRAKLRAELAMPDLPGANDDQEMPAPRKLSYDE